MLLERSPFAPGELYDWMWGCCGGTHASAVWQNNGNDLYAPPGTKLVAPITGRVVRAGVPGIGQGERVGIEGGGRAVYMAHMTRLRVRQGDEVKAGDPVGEVWDFPGVPAHLHFSTAAGTYGVGGFRDPKGDLAATADHLEGRTYRAHGIAREAERPKPDGYWLEALPWHPSAAPANVGPRVLGPWASIDGRNKRLDALRASGEIATPHSGADRFYIFHWRPGAYGRPFRHGPFPTPALSASERARRERADGHKLRPFKGRANSLYPWL